MNSICGPLSYSMEPARPRIANCIDKLKGYLLTDVHERFGRMLLSWHEIKSDGKRLTHDYAACIDTHTWQFYIDCRPRKIFAKCLAQLWLRPLHAVAKTIYHLSMVPILVEIKKTFHREQCGQVCFRNCVRSLADIIRTPLYSTALVVASVAVLLFGAFSPSFLYRGRAWLGAIEQQGNWGEKHNTWTLAPCFQPFSLAVLDAPKYGRHHGDTAYRSSDELDVRLTNFVRSLIHYKRTHRDLFDWCARLEGDCVYVSPILEVMPEHSMNIMSGVV